MDRDQIYNLKHIGTFFVIVSILCCIISMCFILLAVKHEKFFMAVGVFFLFYIVFLFIGVYFLRKSKKLDQRSYEYIMLGMSEDEMLEIMGDNYNRSLLRDGITMYEWIYSSGGVVGSAYMSNGIGFGGGTKINGSKVDIVCRNGVVEEVRPYNC